MQALLRARVGMGSRHSNRVLFLVAAFLAVSAPTGNGAWAADCTAASDGASLAIAIAEVNAGSCDTINITSDITLASQDLPIIDRSGATVVIRGSGGQRRVDGTGTSRLFAVLNGNVTLSDIDIANGLAEGGAAGTPPRAATAAMPRIPLSSAAAPVVAA